MKIAGPFDYLPPELAEAEAEADDDPPPPPLGRGHPTAATCGNSRPATVHWSTPKHRSLETQMLRVLF